MNTVVLGRTGIEVAQNQFGCLPLQRCTQEVAVQLLRRAYEGGMRYFDTARAYTDSEQKLGVAFKGMRDKVYLATKTMAKNADDFRRDLEESLTTLQTDYIDVYQLHLVPQVFKPGDGTGLYEAALQAKDEGLIRHIGVSAHKLGVAEELVESGLFETVQYPFSYLATDREIALVRRAGELNVGFICMKGLAGGLIRNSRAAMAFMTQFPNALPIWGIQHENELEEWLAFMDDVPALDDELRTFIAAERRELAGEFCRGCGYCLPCPQEIKINACARMSLMLRRAPSATWLDENWQAEMAKIDTCLDCRQCASRCPYELDTPNLLRRNLADYRRVLAGEVSVS